MGFFKKLYRVFFYIFIILLLSGFESITLIQTRYKIQVASALKKANVQDVQKSLGYYEDLEIHFLNGRYKYTVGDFATLNEAKEFLSSVPVKGAFIIVVQSKEPVAERIADKKTTVYKIQIAALDEKIPGSYFQDKYGIKDTVEIFFLDNKFKYTIGSFGSFAEAGDYLKTLDFPAFIVRYQQAAAEAEREEVGPAEDSLAQREEPGIADTLLKDSIPVELKDTLPAEDVDTIQSPVETEASVEDYNALIASGDSAFLAKEYSKARTAYQKASDLKPEKYYPKNRIEDIDKKIQDEKRQGLFKRLPWLVYGVIIFFLIMIVITIVITINRSRRDKRSKKDDELRSEYQDAITEYLFDEDAKDEPEILRDADSARKKQVLIDEIMQLYSNLAGEIANKLRELYTDLDLDNESIRKIRSPKWHVQAKGFRELAQMNIKTVNEEIEKCLNSPNNVLRMEAQLALIRLNFENPFSFLDILEKPFSSWEQLHVYEMIQRHQINVPSFSRWLNSPNDSIIVFCVKMIRSFKQMDAYEPMLKLLDHSSEEIRYESIITLGELGNPEILEVLKEKYSNEEQKGRIHIVRAMAKIPEDSNVTFLREIIEPNNEIRIEAAEALSKIESFGTRGIENILRKSDDDLQAIARHILDNKI